MKIRITDLMDHYYDNSIIPEFSDDLDSAQSVPHRKLRFSLHKPLLVAASLLLVLCGIFTVSLRTGIAPSSMAEGDPMPEAPVEEVLPVSEAQETEPVEDSSEMPEEDPSTEVHTKYGDIEPQLTLHSITGNGSLSQEPQIEFYAGEPMGYLLTASYEASEEDKFIHMTVTIEDSNGNQVRYYPSTHTWPGYETETVHRGILPDPITVPGAYTLSVYLDGWLAASVSFPVKEPMESYSAARDITGDGLLTADLNIPYDFMGYETMLLSFTLNPKTGEYTWKGTCPMATEYLSARGISDTEGFSGLLHDEEFSIIFNAYQNHALETYKSSAKLYFSDGTSVILGAGDMIDYEKGVFSDTGKLSWLEADYGISLDGLEPAFLTINDTRYDLH